MTDCLFCKIVAGDIPADVVHETEHDGRVPRHRRRRRRRTCWSSRAATTRTPPRSPPASPQATADLVDRRRGRGRRRRARRGLPARLQHRRGRRPDASSTPTCTCSAVARWAGRPDEPSAPPRRTTARALAALVLLAGCGGRRRHRHDRHRPPRPPARRPADDRGTPPAPGHDPTAARWPGRSRARCARASSRMTLTMPDGVHPVGAQRRRHRRLPLLPARPAGSTQDSFLTGAERAARQPRRRAPRDPVPGAARPGRRGAEAKDAADAGRGLDLLRRHRPARTTAAGRRRQLAGRVGARRHASRCSAGVRRPAGRGSRIVMQVHYNLLAGPRPDTSAAQLRLAPAQRRPHPAAHLLLPAPVELPCRPGHDASPLCDRAAAVADVKARFGRRAGLDRRPAAPAVRRRAGARAGARPAPATVSRADDGARRRRPHAPAGPVDQDRRPTPARRGRGRCWTSRCGTSTTRAPKPIRPVHLDPGDTVRVDLPPRASGCATGCRRSRASRTATSCGARAPPTRCAWGCCRSPSTGSVA